MLGGKKTREFSTVGSAFALQARGLGFESQNFHQVWPGKLLVLCIELNNKLAQLIAGIIVLTKYTLCSSYSQQKIIKVPSQAFGKAKPYKNQHRWHSRKC